jgi:hypothetical protein
MAGFSRFLKFFLLVLVGFCRFLAMNIQETLKMRSLSGLEKIPQKIRKPKYTWFLWFWVKEEIFSVSGIFIEDYLKNLKCWEKSNNRFGLSASKLSKNRKFFWKSPWPKTANTSGVFSFKFCDETRLVWLILLEPVCWS